MPARNRNAARPNLNSSEFLHSRLNLLDDQITINYDLSQPTIANEDNPEKKPNRKRRMSKKEKIAQENNFHVFP